MVGHAAALAAVGLGGLVLGGFVGSWGLGVVTVDSVGMFTVRLDFSGVAMLYSRGVGMFLVAG